jgi:hypothetical protein
MRDLVVRCPDCETVWTLPNGADMTHVRVPHHVAPHSEDEDWICYQIEFVVTGGDDAVDGGDVPLETEVPLEKRSTERTTLTRSVSARERQEAERAAMFARTDVKPATNDDVKADAELAVDAVTAVEMERR